MKIMQVGAVSNEGENGEVDSGAEADTDGLGFVILSEVEGYGGPMETVCTVPDTS